MGEIATGQIWRDTYGNADKHNKAKGWVNKRTIRVLSQEPDGRWLTEAVTDVMGRPAGKTRKSRISEKTFRSGYVLQADGSAA